ncbi:glycosyl transferase family protein [Vibrio sp. AK197]
MSSILECIRTVGRGERGRKPLSFDQAYKIMDEYLDGQVGDDQMAMLMMLIRVQNETYDEIAGFVKAFQKRVPELGADIDWPCYAGKRAATGKPWHLLAAKLLASIGYKVLVHGYHEVGSNREHASHYLDKLGIQQAPSPELARDMLEADSIVYLPLNVFAPEAETMIAWKHRYGLRTPINTVVRALNPGAAKIGLRGSFHPGFQQLHAEVETMIGQHSESVVSFKGVSGESEYNPKVSQTVWMSHKGDVESYYWPEQILTEAPMPKRCVFDTPESDWLTMANAVIATMAAVLFAKFHDRDKAYELAYQLWQSYCDASSEAY